MFGLQEPSVKEKNGLIITIEPESRETGDLVAGEKIDVGDIVIMKDRKIFKLREGVLVDITPENKENGNDNHD